MLAATGEDAVGLDAREFFEALEIRALNAGPVAGDTLEFGLERIVVERGERVSALVQRGFEASDAAEIPSVGDHLIEDSLLDAAVWFDLGEVKDEKFIELGLLFGGSDDDVLGAEAMGSRVSGGTGFAFGGAGACAVLGVLRVGLIGGLQVVFLLKGVYPSRG